MLLYSAWIFIKKLFFGEPYKANVRRKYLLKKDKPDHRDFVYAAPPRKDLPSVVDLRPQMPPVYNQKNLGSCSANAIGAAHQFEQMKQNLTNVFMPSRLFIYFNERVIENSISEDSGACLRDGMKVVAQQGVCPETEWPYDINKFTFKPTDNCYKDALSNVVLSYHSVPQTIDHLCGCLADGYPIIFGLQIYESFESESVAKSGIVPMPSHGEKCLGGHALCLVGFLHQNNVSLCAIVGRKIGELVVIFSFHLSTSPVLRWLQTSGQFVWSNDHGGAKCPKRRTARMEKMVMGERL